MYPGTSLLSGTQLAQAFVTLIVLIVIYTIRHILLQLFFTNDSQPPVVFSWFPLIGLTFEYGADPYKFYFKYQKKVMSGEDFNSGG